MKAAVLLLSVLLVAAGPAETVFDIDFAADTRRVDSVGKNGAFHGVLPRGVGENFAGWSEGSVASEVREEDGRRFLRLVTAPRPAGGQFAIDLPKIALPGVFRLTVIGRVHGGGALSYGLRLHGAPYTGYSSGRFASEDWTETSSFFQVNRAASGNVGFYFYTAPGTADIASIRLETATEDDLAATIRRPPATRVEYVRHARFPLGLPSGWNLGRDCVDAVCTADTAEPAADGTPVLKLSAAKPWELHGEAFQTAYPATPHVLKFRYRSTEPAQVTVFSDTGRGLAGRGLPAAADWREERLVFTPGKLAQAFGLRFSGRKGTFRLDAPSVRPAAFETNASPWTCAVTLGIEKGVIARTTRIQFEDEPAMLRASVAGAPAGAVLKTAVTDLYGRTKTLPPVTLAGWARQELDVGYAVFPAAPRGQFRVTASVERDGRRLSDDEEFVVTRLARPVAWGRDAPDSPFGSHVNPNPAVVTTLKAGGVNWVRLHDAGSQVSGWYAQEPEKGKWDFHDDEVAVYRDARMKIFAQLGTAPAWATHYGDLGYRSMGYFEKYLRPTNMVDWVNYVTRYVRHHRDAIDAYFVWNEPWARWWDGAADITYFDRTRAREDFAALTRLAYDAVKKVDPKIKVSGFNTTAGDGGRKWTEGVLAGGGFDCCDILDWHYYTPNPRGMRDDADITSVPFAPIRARHPDYGGKPVYMSEGQGTSTGASGVSSRMSGLFAASVPWVPETPAAYSRIADMTCRYILSLIAEGNAKVFLYSSHAYQSLACQPNFLVLVGADGFAHPTLVAHAQLARAVEGRRFVRRVNAGAKGVAYVFEGRGGGATVYCDLSAGEVRALALRRPLRDLYGNPVDPACLPSASTVYAEGRPLTADERAALRYLDHVTGTLAADEEKAWWDIGGTQHGIHAIRYHLAFAGYAAAALGLRADPAETATVGRILGNCVERMLQKRVWAYSQSRNYWGAKPWAPDPCARENVMYTGHLLQLMAFYEVFTGDARYREQGFEFVWNESTRIRYDVQKLIDVTVAQMRENPSGGVTCEPGLLFFPCNNHPQIALKLFERLGIGAWPEDAKKWETWSLGRYLGPFFGGGALNIVYHVKSGMFYPRGQPGLDGWSALWYEPWASDRAAAVALWRKAAAKIDWKTFDAPSAEAKGSESCMNPSYVPPAVSAVFLAAAARACDDDATAERLERAVDARYLKRNNGHYRLDIDRGWRIGATAHRIIALTESNGSRLRNLVSPCTTTPQL